ncbi:hypothetical protein P22_0843 [Propionispora sp. 2/2-37]|uniref:amidohydrolase n=1 Tax=Propionispora sp. 2/2-37 TaxID=1677858 RepID=UPI0006C54D00|nr:amidohydrolase [Propionispora sp. 2/2-37]CUH94777.1 hypothetical protein P22_0843 [Propionispora sp. 2/2-37]
MSGIVADIVLQDGVVYTADAKDTLCEAVAVRGNRILHVGSNESVQRYIGMTTRVIDIKGKTVTPGLIDSHIHPPGLSLLELYEVRLYHVDTLKGYLAAVKEFIARNPETAMVYGRGWSWSVFTGEELIKGPRKEYLDEISRDIPIILRANDGHTLWVNSRAFEVNGITAATPVPKGGVIDTDPVTGDLWGTLKEWAMPLIALPEYSIAQYLEAMLLFQKKMHAFGITGILAMGSFSFEAMLETFAAMQRKNKLHLRVRMAATIRQEEEAASQFETVQRLKKQYDSPDLKIITAKFFTDGVVEGGTSHLLKAYSEKAGKGERYYGQFLWDEQKLKQAFAMANQQGLSIHVHSTGDASTRKVLDAMEWVRQQLPGSDWRNTITHLQLVAAGDVERFKKLNIIASVQPYWHFKGPNWWDKVDSQFLGDRAETEFPLGSFFARGITVASSSDYPATLTPNPLLAMDIGVTRNIDNGPLHGVPDITDSDDERYLLNKKERATLQQMIRSFTINGAYMLFLEQETGSLEAGKLADLVVFDRNLFAVNPADIDKAEVDMTIFNGRIVYKKSEAGCRK